MSTPQITRTSARGIAASDGNKRTGKNGLPDTPKTEVKRPSIAFYILLGAASIAFIEAFSLLSPILLSFLLILLISLAVNPVISRMRMLTGGRKVATGLVAAALVAVISLTGVALIGPMKSSLEKFSEQFPGYWARLQKPLIKMEQQAARSEEKVQAEVSAENLVEQVAKISRDLSSNSKVEAIGIAIPGLVNRQTDSVISSRFPSAVAAIGSRSPTLENSTCCSSEAHWTKRTTPLFDPGFP